MIWFFLPSRSQKLGSTKLLHPNTSHINWTTAVILWHLMLSTILSLLGNELWWLPTYSRQLGHFCSLTVMSSFPVCFKECYVCCFHLRSVVTVCLQSRASTSWGCMSKIRLQTFNLWSAHLKKIIKDLASLTWSVTLPTLVLVTFTPHSFSEQPNNSLYTYEGTMDLITSTGITKQIPLGLNQLLLHGVQQAS